jgi:hypothetical protein
MTPHQCPVTVIRDIAEGSRGSMEPSRPGEPPVQFDLDVQVMVWAPTALLPVSLLSLTPTAGGGLGCANPNGAAATRRKSVELSLSTDSESSGSTAFGPVRMLRTWLQCGYWKSWSFDF